MGFKAASLCRCVPHALQPRAREGTDCSVEPREREAGSLTGGAVSKVGGVGVEGVGGGEVVRVESGQHVCQSVADLCVCVGGGGGTITHIWRQERVFGMCVPG
jgi:hypothetical protein